MTTDNAAPETGAGLTTLDLSIATPEETKHA